MKIRPFIFPIIVLILILGTSNSDIPKSVKAKQLNIPADFTSILSRPGVELFEKVNTGGQSDYVQVVNLMQGASITVLHGESVDTGEPGSYNGPNPEYWRQSLNDIWGDFSGTQNNVICVTNAAFFADKHADGTPINPTNLAYPLKKDGVVVSEGYGAFDSYDKLMLEIWPDKADVVPLSKDALYSSDAPNIIAGLAVDADKGINSSVGRTFAGVSDSNNDGTFETVLIFNSLLATQPYAANILEDFSVHPDKMIMLDGGGSTQLICNGHPYVPSSESPDRTIPQSLGVSFAQNTNNAVDVALIIDSSGSMAWNDPDNKRLVAARAYLSASLSGDFVGVVDFDGSARLASPLLELPANKTTLVNAINTIDSIGSTNIGVGVQAGCDALINSPSGNTIKAAILLTDGEGSFNQQDLCFSDRGWPIYTFGFGSANDQLLQDIASTTGGEFARLPTSNFVCEFLRVRSKIAGVEPGSCSTLHIGPLEISIFVINVPPGQQQVSFSTSWTGSDIEMTLISPSGRVIDRNTVAPDVVHDLGPTFEVYTVLDPEPGDWEVTLFGADVPASGEEVVFGFTSIPSSVDPIFNDVPNTHWAWNYIERIYSAGISSGCGTSPLIYCPDVTVSRAQMAIFLLRGRYGSMYNPPPVGASTVFGDVPSNHWAAAWIKQLAAEGITVGCGNGNYCPDYPVTRDQMAVFLLRAEHGPTYVPPDIGVSTGFADVPTDHWAAAWIKQLAVEGITAGCGNGNFCPSTPVSRAQMAVFLVNTFNLP